MLHKLMFGLVALSGLIVGSSICHAAETAKADPQATASIDVWADVEGDVANVGMEAVVDIDGRDIKLSLENVPLKRDGEIVRMRQVQGNVTLHVRMGFAGQLVCASVEALADTGSSTIVAEDGECIFLEPVTLAPVAASSMDVSLRADVHGSQATVNAEITGQLGASHLDAELEDVKISKGSAITFNFKKGWTRYRGTVRWKDNDICVECRATNMFGSVSAKACKEVTAPSPAKEEWVAGVLGNQLLVLGRIQVANAGVVPRLERNDSQGVNHEELLLKVTYQQQPGVWPPALTWKHVHYAEKWEGQTEVQVLHDDHIDTVPVLHK